MITHAEFTHAVEWYLARAVVTAKSRDPRVQEPIEILDGDCGTWAALSDENEALYLAAETALLDAYSPSAAAAHGDWRIP